MNRKERHKVSSFRDFVSREKKNDFFATKRKPHLTTKVRIIRSYLRQKLKGNFARLKNLPS